MDSADVLRLAWEAEHDGRTRLRDTLLTLAVAESKPGEAWAERCRTRLILDRPDHFFARFATVALALQNPRVIEARDRIRQKYPDARIQWLLLKARAARGPYLGRAESLEAMVEDLAGPMAEAENVRRDNAQVSRGPTQRHLAPRPLAFAMAYPSVPTGLEQMAARSRRRTSPHWEETVSEPPLEDFSTYYLTVLLAIAFLLASVQEASDGRSIRG
jgi:hypothetical protein